MRTTLITSVLILLITAISTVPANAQYETEEDIKNEATYLRGGISDLSGYLGVEYIKEEVGFSVGWHKYAPDIADESRHSFDIAANYYLNDGNVEENSWYTGIGYATTNSVRTVNGSATEWSGTWSIVAGYRFAGEMFDAKIGAGYLTSSIMNGAAIDLSVGFTF